jgi:2-keto-4-pentenoate hydratase
MDIEAIERAATLLCRVRLGREGLVGLPEDCRPENEAEAYEVQDVLHRKLSLAGYGDLAGHKIGCTTPVMQRFLGIDNPCAGGVFGTTVQQERGSFRHAGFLHVGVECEIAVRLARNLPASGTPYDRDAAGRAVGAVIAAIEVVDDRYDDYRNLDTPTLIADDFFNAACVLGEPVVDWRGLDLAALPGRMAINGREVGQGRGGDILGDPLEALAWLANSMSSRGRSLADGELVLLGSVVQTVWVEQGDRVEIEIEGLGRVGARFD